MSLAVALTDMCLFTFNTHTHTHTVVMLTLHIPAAVNTHLNI